MNRSNFALFVALLIHLLLILLFWVLGAMLSEVEKIKEPEEKKIKISLKELPKKEKKEPLQEVNRIQDVPPPQIAPPMIKGSQLEEIVKKEPIHYKEKVEQEVPKLNPKPVQDTKPKTVEKPKSLITKELLIPTSFKQKDTPKTETIKEEEKESAMDWLYEDKTKYEKPETKIERATTMSAGKNIKELYGSKFGELSKAQQEYILDNQEIMRRITQQVLTRQARVTNLRGLNVDKINVIEFYLHPNGDMSDFKYLQKSGYFILDEITKVTIEYAYSKYPRPKEKTLIRYNVFYNLRSY